MARRFEMQPWDAGVIAEFDAHIQTLTARRAPDVEYSREKGRRRLLESHPHGDIVVASWQEPPLERWRRLAAVGGPSQRFRRSSIALPLDRTEVGPTLVRFIHETDPPIGEGIIYKCPEGVAVDNVDGLRLHGPTLTYILKERGYPWDTPLTLNLNVSNLMEAHGMIPSQAEIGEVMDILRTHAAS